jgi:hypothetical protein
LAGGESEALTQRAATVRERFDERKPGWVFAPIAKEGSKDRLPSQRFVCFDAFL